MITEPVQDFEAHRTACATCSAADTTGVGAQAMRCPIGRQLRDRAIRSLFWKRVA